MKKKILRVIAIVAVVVLGLAIALPFLLEGKIADIIKNKVNQSINATFDFEDANLSLIKSFPEAYVDLQGVTLINKAPFEGDTLFSAGDIALHMSISELFKSADEPIGINKLSLEAAKLHIKVDTAENANYDIALEEEPAASNSASGQRSSFTFDLKEYTITDSKMIYDDFSSGMHLVISDMNHSGSGDLSLENSKLQTKTEALVSFELDSTQYLNQNKVALDALIGIDLKENKYSFLENSALVNQLPLVFDGFVKVNEENQEVDISFKTPSSDFKNFLAVIPEAYAANLDGVTTTGNFEVNGMFEGVVDAEHIPTFDISIRSENASFKYPDLPKAVRNVFIDTKIKNETGIAEDTYINIDRMGFQIDEDQFNLNAKIRDLLGNTKVGLDADGKINLANIWQAYPMPADYGLTGLVTADVTTSFDMASLEKHQFQNTKTSGRASLTGFHYESEELKNPVDIQEAKLTFNPTTVSLNAFSGKTGQTDFNVTGTLTNLLGYLFNDENLEGRFNLQSNTLAVNDFMVDGTDGEDEATNEEDNPVIEEQVKIPSFLDCTIDASVQNVVYDNLNLTNVSGRLLVKDETVTLQEMTSSLFGGNLNLNGKVSTKPDVPVFDMALGVKEFQISKSFAALDMLKVLAPIAKVLEGKLNSTITLSGKLKNDMTPNLTSLTGNLLAELLSTEINAERTPLLSSLDDKLNFMNLKELNLNGLKTNLNFDNGLVNVKPFDIRYKDFVINVDGGHTFDQKLEYKATIEVPVKYLGAEVSKLLAQINDQSLADVTIPVTANIGGTYTSPQVRTDLTSGVSKLTNQLVEIQKQKLLDQGKDKAKDVLGGLLGQNSDSTQTDSTQASGQEVKDVLGGLLGNKKTDSAVTDAVEENDEVKRAAKNILGGLLGKKKKDTTKQN